jgi:hypothetical protein
VELVDLKHLSQDQLISIINKASALLKEDRYNETFLWTNARNVETDCWWDPSK